MRRSVDKVNYYKNGSSDGTTPLPNRSKLLHIALSQW